MYWVRTPCLNCRPKNWPQIRVASRRPASLVCGIRQAIPAGLAEQEHARSQSVDPADGRIVTHARTNRPPHNTARAVEGELCTGPTKTFILKPEITPSCGLVTPSTCPTGHLARRIFHCSQRHEAISPDCRLYCGCSRTMGLGCQHQEPGSFYDLMPPAMRLRYASIVRSATGGFFDRNIEEGNIRVPPEQRHILPVAFGSLPRIRTVFICPWNLYCKSPSLPAMSCICRTTGKDNYL